MISIQANRVSYILQMFYSKYISMVVNPAGEDRTRPCLLVTSSAFLLTRRTLCLIYLYLNWSGLVMWPWPGARKLKKLRKPLGYLQTSLTDTTKSSNTWFKLSTWNFCIKKGKYETAFAWQSLGKKRVLTRDFSFIWHWDWEKHGVMLSSLAGKHFLLVFSNT